MNPSYGPHITDLQAFAWKLQCPPKLKHFVWQAITGCLSVTARLRGRGIPCDGSCPRCGAESETINHALFECPPSLQVWALSQTPSPLGIFPGLSIYTNFDYLFWRLPPDLVDKAFPWTLWYIWKARNDKVFRGFDWDPQDVTHVAEMEALLWEGAQGADQNGITSMPGSSHFCFLDGSWTSTDVLSGIGWFHNDRDTGILMGARNIRRSQSPLHAEVEALLWAMMCMIDHHKPGVTFATDSQDLVKMVSSPPDWPAFSVYMDDVKRLKSIFSSFSLLYVPRSCNSKADALARSARIYSQDISYVSAVPPAWLSHPV